MTEQTEDGRKLSVCSANSTILLFLTSKLTGLRGVVVIVYM